MQHLRLGKTALQVGVGHILVEGAIVRRILQEVHQVVAYQCLVTAYGRQRRHRLKRGAQVHLHPREFTAIQPFAIRIVDGPGQLQVGHKKVAVVLPRLPVETQAVIEHMGPQRILRRRQAVHKGLHALEVVAHDGWIIGVGPGDIITRA